MKSLLTSILATVTFFALLASSHAAEDAVQNRLVLGVNDCIRIALKSAPELGEAQADIELTASKLDEAKSYRYPQIQVLSLFGPAPDASARDITPTITTDRQTKLSELT